MDLHAYDRQNATLAWADAFTVQQEAVAEAKNSPQLRASIADAITKAEGALRDAATDQEREDARGALANQRRIQQQMTFDPEAFREGMQRWRFIRADLTHLDWDLTKPIEVEALPGGKFKLWQAGSDLHAEWGEAHFAVASMFFKFVSDTQAAAPDPVEYTKRMLSEQGITADNFHEHADKLAISNPWKSDTNRIITEGLDAFITKGKP